MLGKWRTTRRKIDGIGCSKIMLRQPEESLNQHFRPKASGNHNKQYQN